MAHSVYVVLLRAIGPITHRIMSTQAWRDGAKAAGFHDPQTVLATGNMVLVSGLGSRAVEQRMTDVVRGLGLGENVAVVARTPAALARIVNAAPFAESARTRPSQIGVYFFKNATPDLSWVDTYSGNEAIAVVGRHLVVDYGDQDGQGLRLPALIEKWSGTVTARNWSTLMRLAERAVARQKDL